MANGINKINVFVVVFSLFPMGDMPELLYTLIAKGRAVSVVKSKRKSVVKVMQQHSDFQLIKICAVRYFLKSHCKCFVFLFLEAPPTLLCQGFCPSDPLGAGF